MDALLAQALELVSEDRRGQLADIIEAMVDQAKTAPPKVHIMAVGPRFTDIVGVYASLYDLERHAAQLLIGSYSRGEFVVKGRQPTPQVLDVIGAYEAAAHLAYTRAAQIKGDQGTTRAVDELNALGDRLAECANRVDEGLEVTPCT